MAFIRRLSYRKQRSEGVCATSHFLSKQSHRREALFLLILNMRKIRYL